MGEWEIEWGQTEQSKKKTLTKINNQRLNGNICVEFFTWNAFVCKNHHDYW